MKQYTGFVNEISCLAFSPDGRYLAIGASYEHDNGVPGVEERTRMGVMVKTTVMEDCKVSFELGPGGVAQGNVGSYRWFDSGFIA